jgi:hypothetical protein
MVRQNVEGLMHEAFRIIDTASFGERTVVEIKPELVFMQASDGAAAPAGAVSGDRRRTPGRTRV